MHAGRRGRRTCSREGAAECCQQAGLLLLIVCRRPSQHDAVHPPRQAQQCCAERQACMEDPVAIPALGAVLKPACTAPLASQGELCSPHQLL